MGEEGFGVAFVLAALRVKVVALFHNLNPLPRE
jgi:hypothetical protein